MPRLPDDELETKPDRGSTAMRDRNARDAPRRATNARDPSMTSRDFPRRVGALTDVVDFVEASLLGSGLDRAKRDVVQFAVEELLTNMIKYAACGAPLITIEIDCRDGAAEVTLIDADVEPFDPRTTPDAPVDAPLAERRPGGLGLHLVRRIVDALHYDYVAARREGRTRFRVAPSEPSSEPSTHADG